ncbi:MAG: hypothetical protein ACYTFK_13685 [Planctomycetota bacterium]
MAATTTTLATAIQTIFGPKMIKTFDEGTPLLNLLGKSPSRGGDSTDWKLNYAGNAGEAYSEGDTPPAAGNQSFADATVAHSNYWNVVQITGHAMDAMKNGYFDGVEKEMMGGVSGLLRTIELALMAQLVAAINDDTSYAGQTRATVHSDSYVVAGGSAALTLAMLSELYEALKLSPRSVGYDPSDHMFLSAPEQWTAYTEIATGITYVGDDESTGVHRPFTTAQTDTSLDAGLQAKSGFYNRIPWFEVNSLTNTYVFLTRRSNILIEESRALTIAPLGKIDDSDRFLLTWGGNLTHEDPFRAGRIEALTT